MGKIAIGSDHAAIQLKQEIVSYLKKHKVEYSDLGTNSETSVDYPDIGRQVATGVSTGTYAMGVLLCGSGIGMSIVANKFSGVRAALCHSLETAELSRRHNNANILVMGARILDHELAISMLQKWLDTPFEGDRHQRRLDKIQEIENS